MNIRNKLKVLFKESKTVSSDTFLEIESELRGNARQLGIDYDNSIIVNTNRVLNSVNDIKDISQGKVQWAGYGSSWLDFVAYEMPQWLATYFYVLNIDNSKILNISKSNINLFESKYVKNKQLPKDAAMDYELISKKYDGVSFRPYNRNIADNSQLWYKSIDVDSIVIVNKKCIRKITLLLDVSDIINDSKNDNF